MDPGGVPVAAPVRFRAATVRNVRGCGAWTESGTCLVVVPGLQSSVSWWTEHPDVIPSYVGEFGSVASASQLGVFAIRGVASVTAVGALRAADILMGPLRSFQQAARQVAQPEAVRVRVGSGRVVRSCALLSAGLAGIAVVAGGALIIVSRSWGPHLLGDSWRAAHPVLLPLSVSIVAAGVLPEVDGQEIASAAPLTSP